VQRKSANILKKNIIDDLESRDLEFPKVREFLTELKREFSSRNNELACQVWFILGMKVHRISSEMQTCGITNSTSVLYGGKRWKEENGVGLLMLWQPLDQCPIAAQVINIKGRYLVENMSYVIHKRT